MCGVGRGGAGVTRKTGPSPATVQLVRERDNHRCVRCGSVRDLTTQHRVPRGMGGTRATWINEPANLITLCGSGTTGCHGYCEHHPTHAKESGWAVSKYANPEDMPVFTWRGWIELDNAGGYRVLDLTPPF